MQYRTAGSLALVTIALLAPGCGGVDDRSDHLNRNDNNYAALCAPTGWATYDTGVYLSPQGCTEVTLYAIGEEVPPTYWVLAVGWPMYGDTYSLQVTNETTGDVEDELFYLGDPEFTLFAGDYNLGGLEVVAGANTITFRVWDTVANTDGTYTDVVIEEGTYTLWVTLSDASSGA